MVDQCPYHSDCSQDLRLRPDRVAAATEVLRVAVGDEITGEERIRKDRFWEKTGSEGVIPLERLPVCNIVCIGYGIYGGQVLFEGVSPVEGQIGVMVIEEAADLLNLAAGERIKCVRYIHFARNSVEMEFPEA